MTVLGLELSDAGIMVAGGDTPHLLAVDGEHTASPGFALPEKRQLTVGLAAQRRAHLVPHQIQHRFWDQLDTAPLTKPIRRAANHAEVAFAHMEMIWEKVKPHCSQMMIAVPGYFTRTQLGLILGMAQELAMPVTGFVTQAVAAAPRPYPGRSLLYLDIHLHRTEITHLTQDEHLTHDSTFTMDEMGLLYLHRLWVETVAEEFVRTTRLDPLHSASGEQELHDRLVDMIPKLHTGADIPFDIRAGHSIHRINLTREMLARTARPLVDQLAGRLHSLLQQNGASLDSATLLLSHRIAGLPGVEEFISSQRHVTSVALEAGASAMNMLRTWHEFDGQTTGKGASFFTSRPWPLSGRPVIRADAVPAESELRPTHLLVGDLAYRLTSSPLYIGPDHSTDGQSVRIDRGPEPVGPHVCALRREGEDIVLTVHSDGEVQVEGRPVEGRMVLRRHMAVQVGAPSQTIRLITCLEDDEA